MGFDLESARRVIGLAEQLRETVGRPDLAMVMVRPYADLAAQEGVEESGKRYLAAVAGALRILAVSGSSLMDGAYLQGLKRILCQPYCQERIWFEAHRRVLDNHPHTVHSDSIHPNINWLAELYLNDTLGAARNLPVLRRKAVVEARRFLADWKGRDFLPGGTEIGDLGNEDGIDTSAAGVALARISRLTCDRVAYERGLELVRWANGENGPVPNSARLAVVENWGRSVGWWRKDVKKAVGISGLALLAAFNYRWAIEPCVSEAAKQMAQELTR